MLRAINTQKTRGAPYVPSYARELGVPGLMARVTPAKPNAPFTVRPRPRSRDPRAQPQARAEEVHWQARAGDHCGPAPRVQEGPGVGRGNGKTYSMSKHRTILDHTDADTAMGVGQVGNG